MIKALQNGRFETNPVQDTRWHAHTHTAYFVEMDLDNVPVEVVQVAVVLVNVSFLSSTADLRIAVHHSVAFAPGKAEWTDFGDDGRRL